MEATGVYHLRLAYALNKIGVFVSVVNPLSVKNFSRAVMCRTKTVLCPSVENEYAPGNNPLNGSGDETTEE